MALSGLQLFYTAALMMIALAEKGDSCEISHLMTIQQTCGEQNDQFLAALVLKENEKLCLSLYEMLHCVVLHVPVCFNNMTHTYESYFHSPHSCLLTPNQTRTLQDVIRDSMSRPRDDGGSDGGGDVYGGSGDDVHIVPLSSSTAKPVTPTTTLSIASTDDDGGGGGESGKNGTTGTQNEKGGVHKHTGSGVRVSCHYTLAQAILASLAIWRFTSYCVPS